MWLFSGIKSTYKKSEAAAVVQTLLKHQADIGTLNLDSVLLANKLVALVWDSKPDIFNGKFGQRPHKITVAAFALANGIDLVAKDKQNQNALAIALSTILSEVETNGTLYPFNSLDHQLLETSMAIFLDFAEELDKSPLGNEIDTFVEIESKHTDKLAECRKAAEQGNVSAQCDLGLAYAKGLHGIAKDESKAVMWYRKAAEQGDAEAQNNLGIMYTNGNGVTKDDTQVVKWFRKATEQGLADAQYNLSVMYGNGTGIAKDEAQSVVLCRKAAEQGYGAAQNNLGMMYANGVGVAKNEAQAAVWYRKAAEQGHKMSQFNLALAYAQGKGVTQNIEQAIVWCRKAAEQGLEEAHKALVLFERLKNKQLIK